MFKSIENSAELQKYIFTYGVNEHPLQKEIRELETMEEFINQDKMFDLIFIDADKKNYKNYFLKSLELLEKDGIIIIDNTLWKGKVFDLNITDDQTNSIREFNSFVRDFKGTDSMILPIADGMTICRKL
ncbi:MAG: hypothetical protein EBW89_01300 [Candidatus Fonsibacter ubiquis]|nr:hypothetical protein [Candidatus Fonsibacter ubiquis]